MVRALLSGTKTQTRRIVKPQPPTFHGDEANSAAGHAGEYVSALKCPHGQPGDRLWVRETSSQPGGTIHYRADDAPHAEVLVWKPSIFMRRHESRINLEITAVRVERLQDISTDDVDAEGFGGDWPHVVLPELFNEERDSGMSMQDCYGRLWESINGPGS